MRSDAIEFIRKRETKRLEWRRDVSRWRMNQFALETKRVTDLARSDYSALQLKADQVIARARDEQDAIRSKWTNSRKEHDHVEAKKDTA